MTVQPEVEVDDLLACLKELGELNAKIREGLAQARRGRPRLSAAPLTLPDRAPDRR